MFVFINNIMRTLIRLNQLFFESPTVIPAAWEWSLPPAPPPPPILFSAVVIGLYRADIAGLFGGIGGGIPLFPIDDEVDEEALAYNLKYEKGVNIMIIIALYYCKNILQKKIIIQVTFNDDEDTDSFPIPTPPLLITLCIIDDDPPLVPKTKTLYRFR